MLLRPRSFFVLLLAPFAWGCEVEIGDDCTTAADCSQSEPRLCLTDALEGYPGGYCTIFNCDTGSCPSESVCVAYRANLSESEMCGGASVETRLQRSFCMRSCSNDSDCRGGYACIDLGVEDPWGAEVVEREGRNTKVCAVAYEGPDIPVDRPSDVCRSAPGSVPLPSASGPAGSTDSGASSDGSGEVDSGPPGVGDEVDSGRGAMSVDSGATEVEGGTGTSSAVPATSADAAPDADAP